MDEKLPFRCDDFDFTCQRSCSVPFDADVFEHTMLNLVQNPNILSSHLYRADVFYDSIKDVAGLEHLQGDRDEPSALLKQMKAEYQPTRIQVQDVEGSNLTRVIVRQLIARNPHIDKHLIQTCCFVETHQSTADSSTVLYLPHVSSAETMPFYHPPVRALAFHFSQTSTESKTFSIFISPFPGTTIESLGPRFQNTLKNLLATITKHGRQNSVGYTKRVNHDRLIPRARYQDTLVRLKMKYAKALLHDWQESTDPVKNVFEDLCIASFLMELWRDTYPEDSIPDFVDIGCGNGLLVHILRSEGYSGKGFDARLRKSWSHYPSFVVDSLETKIFTPPIYPSPEDLDGDGDVQKTATATKIAGGTFIISNHADELTPWTPLVAYLYRCPFIAIPCCSHDLSGKRCRFPPRKPVKKEEVQDEDEDEDQDPRHHEEDVVRTKQAAETGSLRRPPPKPSTPDEKSGKKPPKQPSAYATLCDYIAQLAHEVGFEVEREVLRIPSTRNVAIVGRRFASTSAEDEGERFEARLDKVRRIVERDVKMGLASAAFEWRERMKGVVKGKGGHA